MNADTPPPQLRKPRGGKDFDPELNPEYATVPVEAEQPSGSERILHGLWEVLKAVAFIVLAAVIIRVFVVQPFFVQGDSMEPDFHNGDYLLVNQISYRFSAPKRGDVIIFEAPTEPDTNYIKRIIGLPGETVELKNGRVIVKNDKHPGGVAVDEPYIQPGVLTLPDSEQTSWSVGQGQYFVLGDNREPGRSSDSRSWGLLPKQNIIGQAWIRAYPIHGIGAVKHERYPNLSTSPGWLVSAV